jgi:hypothetical protein
MAFFQHVQNLEKLGIQDVQQLEQLAVNLMQGDMARQQIMAQQRQQQMQQPYPAQQFTQPPQGPNVPRYQQNYNPPPTSQGVPQGSGSYAAQLRQAMLASGEGPEFPDDAN